MESSNNAVGKIEAIRIYPVKSCQGVAIEYLQFSNYGLKYDRTWAIVSSRPGSCSSRLYVHNQYDWHPNLASIRIAMTEEYLVLSHPDMPASNLKIPLRLAGQKKRPVLVGQVQRTEPSSFAFDEGDAAAMWLCGVLCSTKGFSNFKFRLVRAVGEYFRDLTDLLDYLS